MNDLEFQCPECGAEVHPNARGCKHCGARQEGGKWGHSETYDGLDLPGDDDFDYDKFIAEEFGEGPKSGWGGLSKKQLFWSVVAAVTLLAFFFVFAIWPQPM